MDQSRHATSRPGFVRRLFAAVRARFTTSLTRADLPARDPVDAAHWDHVTDGDGLPEVTLPRAENTPRRDTAVASEPARELVGSDRR